MPSLVGQPLDTLGAAWRGLASGVETGFKSLPAPAALFPALWVPSPRLAPALPPSHPDPPGAGGDSSGGTPPLVVI